MGTYFLLPILFLFSIAYVQASHVSEEQCSPTDIRETNPHIKNNPELKAHFSTPLDQDSIGWCYGFAAADMVTAEIGTPISASHVSNIYNEKVENNSFLRKGYDLVKKFNPFLKDGIYEGGLVGMAIKAIVKEGKVCRESDFPFDRDYEGQMNELISSIEYIKRQTKNNKYSEEVACQATNYVFSFSGFESVWFDNLSTSIANSSINKMMSEAAQQSCKDMVELPKLKTKRILKPHTKWGIKRYFKHVNKALEKGKPISFLFNAKHFTINEGPHIATAVARRWNNGRCEYKIRNSWGKTCEPYLPGIECNREEGSFWISDSDIQKHVYMTNFIKD